MRQLLISHFLSSPSKFLVTRQKGGIQGGTFFLLLLDNYIINFLYASEHNMHICICTSAQCSSTTIASISFKPLDHALSLSTCVLLGLTLSAWLQQGLFSSQQCIQFCALLLWLGWCWQHTVFWLLMSSDFTVSRFSFQPRGVGRRLGGYTAHLADTDQRNITYIPMILCSAKKTEEGRRTWGCWLSLWLPQHMHQCVLRSCSPGNGWTSA